ncbi:MAG TPA: hypothetical protein V6C99_08500 [Oculatellaceae cyanobacterium]
MVTDVPRLPERRWYDAIGQMTMALYLSRQLPGEIQQLIAKHLNQAIDEHRQRHKVDRYTASLGPQRTISLYKTASKKRWYDGDPSLHRALTMMIGMPQTYLEEFASRVLDVTQYWVSQQQAGNLVLDPNGYLLSDAVEHILKAEEQMLLKQNEGGIRLIMGSQHHLRQSSLPIHRHRGKAH